ncbi:hypothetical protein, partial [Parasphingorhabdus sp.]|uniref:hypothetical protein n=1 Tax=Parasphingorhabdus sp. TaxID=2709688 RepID=UPI0035936903
ADFARSNHLPADFEQIMLASIGHVSPPTGLFYGAEMLKIASQIMQQLPCRVGQGSHSSVRFLQRSGEIWWFSIAMGGALVLPLRQINGAVFERGSGPGLTCPW